MPDFNKGSTFNKDANFQGVKFGADAPLLETELNELQDIQTEARADIIRDTIPSGFVQLGELDFDYMFNNENCVKLKTDSVAYVNGYKILIPKDTIVDIGKAPEKDAREDLLFLEVWKEEVTKDSVLTVAGGEGQAQINNPILDDRVGQETSRRIALKWRIRHIPNFDFNISWSQANEGADKYIGLSSNGSSYPNLIPQGGKSTPTTKLSWFKVLQNRSLQPYVTKEGLLNPTSGDPGLWSNMCYKDRVEETKIELNTLDGFVYAIPMFRLYRKPSCGKAIPFEYQKINPKVDYSKFTNLIKEEKVERVVSETIGGRSLVNLIKTTKYNGTHNACLEYNIPVKENTKYTVIVEDYSEQFYNSAFITTSSTYLTSKPSNGDTLYLNTVSNGTGTEHIVSKITPSRREQNRFVGVITTKQGEIYMGLRSGGQDNSGFRYSKARIIEGDWLDKEIPEYFTGLKSLGEDEGNLITVKNGILNESSYDPDTGTPKLNTVEGTNYITSDNLLMPTIEGQVKRGEVKVSDLTSFGKVDSLVGDEKVEFIKIKGRTLKNSIINGDFKTNANWLASSGSISVSNGILTHTANGEVNYPYVTQLGKLIIGHKYYVQVEAMVSTSDCKGIDFKLDNNTMHYSIKTFTPKVWNKAGYIVTANSEECTMRVHHNYETKEISIGKQLSLRNALLIDLTECFGVGSEPSLDWCNSNIAFLDEIKSVGENENNKVIVKRTGKNLFKPSVSLGSYAYPSVTNRLRTNYCIPLLPGQSITVSCENLQFGIIGVDSLNTYKPANYDTGWKTGTFTFRTDDVAQKFIGLTFRKSDDSTMDISLINNANVLIEYSTTKTEYEPYKGYKQEITLKEPLRSLPNGVCDTIEGNKVIRRVGKVILNGSERWQNWVGTITQPNTLPFMVNNLLPNGATNPDSTIRFISDKFPSYGSPGSLNTVDTDGIASHNSIYIRISKSKLSTQDLQGFKTWLSQNPTTVYYELANPVEELIEPNYDKESIKTYQLDQPLRSLPNGVKDEIVDGKLIRRCGEVILNGSENWRIDPNPTDNTIAFKCLDEIGNVVPLNNKGANAISDKFISDFLLYGSATEGFSIYSEKMIAIRILKTKITSQDVDGFKTWLKANPVKVVYELETPIEIPLKEVLPSKADFSLARQFNYTDNYLLELPDGVKDTVENGKVIRRVGKLKFDGSENWIFSENGDYVRFWTSSHTSKFAQCSDSTTNVLCDKFKSYPYLNENKQSFAKLNLEGVSDTLYRASTDRQIQIQILKSRLTSVTVESFKSWLNTFNLTIYYPLATPTTEELSGNNNRYCPYHIEDNTYCGSMYVGDGANDVIVENGLKTENVIIDTPFRSITDKEVVTDCKYKKSVDGYDTMDKTSKSANLVDTRNFVNFVSTPNVAKSDTNVYPITLKSPKIKFSIFSNGVAIADGNFAIRFCDKDLKGITWWSTNKINREAELVPNFREIAYICLFHNNSVSTNKTIDGICITYQDGDSSKLVPFVPCEVAFENTEENDIDDLRHQVSLTGFNYEQILNESFDKLLRGEL